MQYLLLFIAIIGIAVLCLYILHQNKLVDPRKATLRNKWVTKGIYKYAHKLAGNYFAQNGKPVRTQKGDYRADYMRCVNKTANQLMQICCNGDVFCTDFADFIAKKEPPVRIRSFSNCIEEYVDYRERSLDENLDAFLNNIEEITPAEFFQIKSRTNGDYVGAYVIHNEDKDMYYVGQAKRLFFRVNQHFTGHGNGDVYADYKNGDDFSIKIIVLSNSGYSDIDLLEKDLIRKYDAYTSGYNRTVGNQS